MSNEIYWGDAPTVVNRYKEGEQGVWRPSSEAAAALLAYLLAEYGIEQFCECCLVAAVLDQAVSDALTLESWVCSDGIPAKTPVCPVTATSKRYPRSVPVERFSASEARKFALESIGAAAVRYDAPELRDILESELGNKKPAEAG